MIHVSCVKNELEDRLTWKKLKDQNLLQPVRRHHTNIIFQHPAGAVLQRPPD